MGRRGDRGIKKGGLGDPVAQTIRNEQNRDAMPSPEEAKREHMNWLKNKGCKVCGEDDPEKLNEVMPHMHSCSAHQHPRDMEPEVYCDDHKRGAREMWLEDQLSKLKQDDVIAIVIYECDITRTVKEPEPETQKVKQQVGRDDEGNPVYEEVEQEVPRRHPPQPEAPVQCRGAHGIKKVYYEDDVGSSE